MSKIVLITILSLMFRTLLFAQDIQCYHADPKARYREHQVDFKSAKISISFQPKQSKVIGEVEYIFQPKRLHLDTLFLDAPGIQIQKVLLNESEQAFSLQPDGVVITFNKNLNWDSTYRLHITYDCIPAKGLYFIGWNDPKHLMREQIWTQGQGVDNRYWIPGFDDVADKLITETVITFDSAYEVVSNGNLENIRINKDGTKTWYYKMDHPHVLYLVMIAIGKYGSITKRSASGVPIKQYYYSDRYDCVEPTYRYSELMMDWQEEELGVKFPWKTYANVPVQEFLYGAMENTTATIFTDYYYQDNRGFLDRSYVGVNCHEQTHQWFGDMITELSATHHWLHESFATHYAKHFRRYVFGEDEFNWIRREEMRSAWSSDELNDIPIAHSQGGSSRHYAKGSLVIDMLRYVLGEQEFRRAVTYYLKKHAYQSVDSNDFYRAFFECLGVNLDWFFQEWVYRGAYPKYVVEKTEVGDTVLIQVKQTQTQTSTVSTFKMPIVLSFHYTDKTFDTLKIFNDTAFQTIRFIKPHNKTVQFVLFDKGYKIYKKVEFKKTYEELIAQARNAQDMIDRYDAIFALKSYSSDKKRIDLTEIFNNEPFWSVRAEIIKQLNKDVSSLPLLKKACNDPHHMVRRATIEDVEVLPAKLKSDIIRMLNDSSYYNVENALEILSNSYPRETKSFLEKTKDIEGISHNVRLKWLEKATKSDSSYLSELIGYSSSSYEFRTRVNAFHVIEHLNLQNDDIYLNLLEAMLNFNGRLSGPAKNTITSLLTTESQKRRVKELILKFPQFSAESRNKLIEGLTL